jgi:hypothetical protein
MMSLANSYQNIYDKKILAEVSSNSLGIITTDLEIQAYHTRTLTIQNKKTYERIMFTTKSFSILA